MDQTREPIRPRQRGISWPAVLQFALRLVPAALLLAFIVRNRTEITIDFLFGTVYTSLIWALLIAAGLGFVLGVLVRRERRW